ncbi:hypothetical protein OQX61_19025 [Pedobacter sp. PLR]|uniref:lipopolysaccharide biosynthesis protein n=1 Tax=Pedobacter sp. PLR TaxID=2994465 RepID=UPI002245BC6D|nr:hypothetical protein [Pedobacter sp. PLR]MCX2453371.1 hypothetical protein [Pedobacter sp. PLR]
MVNPFKIYKSLEREIISSLIFRLLYILVQLSTVVIVGHFFLPITAGYYFVLNSYTALSVFFELGVSFVIMQNAAHESAKLVRADFDQPGIKLNRLSSLFSFTYKWFFISSLLFIALVVISSPFFFSHQAINNVNWQGPLIVLSIAIGMNLLLNGIYAFFEGCRFIYEISIIKIIQTVSFLIIFIALVFSGAELYAYGIGLVLSISISLIATFKLKIWKYYKSIVASDKNADQIMWAKDLLPYQWRFAVSTISGFLIFQLINLLTFKFQGPIVAGKLGLTLSLINGIITISMVWFNTRAPMFATLVANKQITELRELFKKTLAICVLFHLALSICFIIFKVVIIDYYQLIFNNRLLDNLSIYLLLFNSLINVIIFGLASFCRSDKNEPFLINSIVFGIINSLFSIILIKYYSLFHFILFMVGCTLLVNLPWALNIYKGVLRKFLDKKNTV